MALESKQRCSKCVRGWAYPRVTYDKLARDEWLRRERLHFLCKRCLERWMLDFERSLAKGVAS